MNHQLRALLLDSGDDRVEGDQVAVDIGNDR
jgi:hypothetical protein